MPPRKSNVSTASADEPMSNGLSVEDLNLPKTMVQRLAKGVLPPNTIIQKDALLAVSKSATVFVNYVTNAANENAQRSAKKTIQPKDVLEALRELEFEAFLPRVEAELQKFTTDTCNKRNSYRARVRDEKKKAEVPGQPEPVNGHAKSDDEPRAAKRARRSDGTAEDQAEGSGDEDMDNEDQAEEEQQDSEAEEDEQEEEGEGSGPEELAEDPLEEREQEEEEASGDESD